MKSSGPLRLPQMLASRLDRQINRAPSPVFAIAGPWISVILASLLPGWLVIASAPVLPPFGFLMLLAWRQVRPGILPVWSGMVLGAFDDLISGQPFGSAIVLWSLAMIGLDVLEMRVPWRSFATEWMVASGLITATLVVSVLFANASGGSTELWIVAPQIVLSILLFPVVARMVAWIDRARLLRFTVLS